MATDFRDLRVWEEAMALAEMVYGATASFPVDERYGLAAQVKRAAVSVPSCIVEGNARSSTRDYLRFRSMAKGSLVEVQTQIQLALRLGFLDKSAADQVLEKARLTSVLLLGLRKSLAAKLPRTSSSPLPIPASPL
ncbi:MAG: four helix bundle protein [Pseudomonadota bacterium]|nr:four helix bundle protein [Pseudomonadota bacterium]